MILSIIYCKRHWPISQTDWFEACWEEMQPVTEAKKKAMLAHKENPFPSTRDALRAARSKAKQTARRCANKYWQNLCAKTQLAVDCGHAKGMYEGIKTATGPTSVKTDWRGNHWSEHAAAALGGALSRALRNPEHCQTQPLMPCLGCQS